MRPATEVHDALACLLAYPGEDGGGARYPAAIELVCEACPEASDGLRAFADGISLLDEGQLEELYTRTFDNVADRSLEIGWHLFGENYARATLLVRFRELLREYGVPEGTELPDHMTHALPLLGRAPAPLARSFATSHVLQATEKILAGLRACESPWVGVLEATRAVLERHREESTVPSEVTR